MRCYDQGKGFLILLTNNFLYALTLVHHCQQV